MALPPANGWPAVGRSTVLQAYRQLRNEGVVSMLPSRGTIIRPMGVRRRCAFVVDPPEAEQYSAFELQVQVEVMEVFSEAGFDMVLYPISRYMRKGTGESRCVSRELASDAAAGLVAGAVLSVSPAFQDVFDWMKKRGIPVVCARDIESSGMPHIKLDRHLTLESGLRRLAELGHQRILMIDTMGVAPRDVQGLSVVTHCSPAGMESGRRLAGKLAKPIADGRFDAVFVTDDWLALGFLLQLRAQGVSLPGATAMLVACNSGQLSEAFTGCEKMVLSTRRIAEKILELYRSVTTKGAAPVDPNVVHTFIPGEWKGSKLQCRVPGAAKRKRNDPPLPGQRGADKEWHT